MQELANDTPLRDVPIFKRLFLRFAVWNMLSLSNLVRGMLEEGLDLSFYLSSTPHQSLTDRSILYKRQSSDPKFLETLQDLCVSGVLSRVPENLVSKVFVLHTFPVPKPDRTIRPVVDWRPLNSLLRCDHFQMEGIRTVFSLVQRGDFLIKLDIEKAYWHVRLSESSARLGAVFFRDTIWHFNCMAFGLSIAPRLFTKHLVPVVEHLRGVHHFRMVVYLDDFIQCNQSASVLKLEGATTSRLLENLGWLLSPTKCMLNPSQCAVVLGFIIDTVHMLARIPPKKLDLLKGELSRTLARARVSTLTLRQLARTVGMLRSNSYAVRNTGAKLLEMQHVVRFNSRLSLPWDCVVPIPQVVLLELQFWLYSIDSWNGRSFAPFNANVVITTDASETGWGSQVISPVVRSPAAQGSWSSSELSLHINELEILAVSNGLRAHVAANGWHDTSILIGIDNRCALSYLLKTSGRILKLARLIRKLVLWAEERDHSSW